MYRVVGQNTAFLGRKVAGFLVGFHEIDGKELSRSHHKELSRSHHKDGILDKYTTIGKNNF